ncbi:replication protein A 70 kDa DNA-binding subunit B [Daucus carota subsp. sativus]|nr:PREDICTED: replication protein A 70 kDa DNA-binding subunit B-like [Daucus carota subsp. sativus]XP_017238126.1 PREDICTED: replication protein A 70 kDa DNA-binding subunit B-like [Daucus carota subsp. sativus]XP_017238127.1 PREDICTED: replication protein A 70 kDa DNA-binding subunit B-like [Daucus carota subsp. sativus]XP_017238128.1 PREDICTED: replication protein A 70 kDa DNA-binding subunit B-like [Daucus carota subsp. sativus]XP_017238129.1 PREDICTED: replication protein A 70 kDa DNA-bind
MEIPPGKDQVRGLCTATITEIMEGNGWLYNCCSKCARAVHPTQGKYFCAACNADNITVSQRYRVVARIKDDTGTTTVTLFNKEAEQLIGAPIQKLINEVTEGTDMEEIPPAIKNIVGKLCAFQIKINNYNITHGCEEYTVTRVSECSNDEAGSSDGVNVVHKDKRVRLD